MYPKLSVIVPVYNVEKYLKKCLDSILNQTYKNLEIICVYDDSNDSTVEIAKEYVQKDSRIKLIKNEEIFVVGAGSIVVKDIEDYTVVAGVPAKPIKFYNSETKEWQRCN